MTTRVWAATDGYRIVVPLIAGTACVLGAMTAVGSERPALAVRAAATPLPKYGPPTPMTPCRAGLVRQPGGCGLDEFVSSPARLLPVISSLMMAEARTPRRPSGGPMHGPSGGPAPVPEAGLEPPTRGL
jgi:hypothetical protein